MRNKTLFEKILEHDFDVADFTFSKLYEESEEFGTDYYCIEDAAEVLNLAFFIETNTIQSSVFDIRRTKLTARLWKKDE